MTNGGYRIQWGDAFIDAARSRRMHAHIYVTYRHSIRIFIYEYQWTLHLIPQNIWMLMMCYTCFSRPIKMGTCRRRRRTGKPHQDGRHVTATESSGKRERESESKSESESESESESKSESASQSGFVCIEMDVMAPPLSHWARKHTTTHCNILQCTATHCNTL